MYFLNVAQGIQWYEDSNGAASQVYSGAAAVVQTQPGNRAQAQTQTQVQSQAQAQAHAQAATNPSSQSASVTQVSGKNKMRTVYNVLAIMMCFKLI